MYLSIFSLVVSLIIPLMSWRFHSIRIGFNFSDLSLHSNWKSFSFFSVFGKNVLKYVYPLSLYHFSSYLFSLCQSVLLSSLNVVMFRIRDSHSHSHPVVRGANVSMPPFCFGFWQLESFVEFYAWVCVCVCFQCG